MKISKKALILLASFAAAFFLAVLTKIYVIRNGYQLSALEEEEKRKILELSQAEADLAQAKSLEDLSPRAKIMGFRFPAEYGLDKIRFLKEK